MAQRLTKGAVQVSDVSITSINIALAELTRRIDELSGLHGRVLMEDRLRVDTGIELDDAATVEQLP